MKNYDKSCFKILASCAVPLVLIPALTWLTFLKSLRKLDKDHRIRNCQSKDL